VILKSHRTRYANLCLWIIDPSNKYVWFPSIDIVYSIYYNIVRQINILFIICIEIIYWSKFIQICDLLIAYSVFVFRDQLRGIMIKNIKRFWWIYYTIIISPFLRKFVGKMNEISSFQFRWSASTYLLLRRLRECKSESSLKLMGSGDHVIFNKICSQNTLTRLCRTADKLIKRVCKLCFGHCS